MLVFKLALRNLARRPRRSLTLLLILMAAIFILFVGNSVFDGTSAGIAESFVRSFTGDLVVRARDSESYSLFGNETPIIGELSELPELVPYRDLCDYLGSLPDIKEMTPQVSGVAYIELSDYRMPVPLFGIAGESYFNAFDGVTITRGHALTAGEKGILISEARWAEIARLSGHKLELGESIQLSIATDTSFRIRALPLVGITHYPVDNATTDRIVLIDAGTLRSLYGIGASSSRLNTAPAKDTSLLDSGIDELFADAQKDTSANGKSLDRSGIEADLAKREKVVQVDSSAGPWHYLILRLVPAAKIARLRHMLNREFAARGWPLEAVIWRVAAGSGALYVYWLRIIFNIGVVVVAFAGLIVIVNALVSGVLERIGEIGTMRALGAQRAFVQRLFALETTVLALAAGILGVVFGVLVTEALAKRGIAISNPFLIQLFGGARLKPGFDVAAVFRAILSSLVMGSLAWTYPVSLALRVQPVEAMAKHE